MGLVPGVCRGRQRLRDAVLRGGCFIGSMFGAVLFFFGILLLKLSPVAALPSPLTAIDIQLNWQI
jgi:hypothetical protein